MAQKPSFEEFKASCLEAIGLPDIPTAEKAHRMNMLAASAEANSSHIWAGVLDTLKNMGSEYSGGRSELLFYPADAASDLKIHTKPLESTLLKIYRNNVIYNRNYPEAPRAGLIDPVDMYSAIDDLLRTRIVCKYMDGPKFVCHKLEAFCQAQGAEYNHRSLSTDAGYYAWHFYVRFSAPVNIAGNIKDCSMWIEIQITTQLAEVITSLTHSIYEERRVSGGNKGEWKWEAESPEFKSAYLGHGLHLLEGVIQSFKDDMIKPKNEGSAE
ncbi:hypothetical protein K8U54_15630 [Pseudomonas fulva]|uniref:hypothetical protein n=1 Tax=Pseudomonas fulva TaxID=47880 RepID=UPI00201D3D1B|nr:hypothetical protein [Pseudomonas fulva]UQY33150.1 hypothetical protein K8U54_15630 [Pseudomonas fulva]